MKIESEAGRKAFFEMLDSPPKPTKCLIEAFALRKKLIANAEQQQRLCNQTSPQHNTLCTLSQSNRLGRFKGWTVWYSHPKQQKTVCVA